MRRDSPETTKHREQQFAFHQKQESMSDMLANISKEKAVSLPNAKYVLFLIDRMDSPAFCNALGRFTEPGLKNINAL